MSYLPPGWTEERLRTITEDDLRQIPEDKLCEIDQDLIPVENVRVHIILGRARRYEKRRLERERKGLPPAPPRDIFEIPDDPVVQRVLREGYDDFGFVVFRTDYSDQAKWEEWQKEWNRRLEASIARAQGGSKIEDKSFTALYEHPDLHGVDFQEVQQYFHGYRESENLPPGLDHGVALVVDKEAMESITSTEPWAYAVDMWFAHGSHVEEGECPGYFRVALDSVVTDLYPMVGVMGVNELWPQDGSIFISPFQL